METVSRFCWAHLVFCLSSVLSSWARYTPGPPRFQKLSTGNWARRDEATCSTWSEIMLSWCQMLRVELTLCQQSAVKEWLSGFPFSLLVMTILRILWPSWSIWTTFDWTPINKISEQTISKRPPGRECRSHDFFPMIQHTQWFGPDFL